MVTLYEPSVVVDPVKPAPIVIVAADDRYLKITIPEPPAAALPPLSVVLPPPPPPVFVPPAVGADGEP